MKLRYLLCVLHLLESGKDAFHNEIHLDVMVDMWNGYMVESSREDDSMGLMVMMENEDHVEMTRL